MRRLAIPPRRDWQDQVERLGFDFHTAADAPYWDESVAYSFTLAEIEEDIEAPTAELEQLCIAFVSRAIRDDEILSRLAIPPAQWPLIRDSWERGDRPLYGRLDLAYDGSGPAKLLEYNADTPTALFEASVVQWDWLEASVRDGRLPEGADQFNSLHEALVSAFAGLGPPPPDFMHFAAMSDSAEDRATVEYLRDCAGQAGLSTRFLTVEAIGLLADGRFCDDTGQPITDLFKLYPWEWMWRDAYSAALAGARCRFLEPPWKAVLSNKGLLPCLWASEPGHPNLLPAYFEGDPKASALGAHYVRKPIYSREGANVTLMRGGSVLDGEDGPYGAEGFILQAAAGKATFAGHYPVLGSWLVASRPCGLGLREGSTAITNNTSRFVPHVIEG